MGVDARINDLPNEVLYAEFISLYNTIKLACDDPTYSAGDSKKILIKTVLQKVSDDISANASAINLRALKANVIEKGNTTEFIPTLQYEPSTKGYVDAYNVRLWGRGYVTISGGLSFLYPTPNYSISVVRTSTGLYTITHNFGSLNYIVVANPTPTSGNISTCSIDISSNSFTVSFGDDSTGLNDTSFDFSILSIGV